jgi:HK97 family phage prohead protease
MKNIYLTKELKSEVKDVDLQTYTVKMAIAHFGNIDKVGDVIDSKAFDKTISISQHKWHFINHNADLFVGKFKELYKENDYLVAVSQLDINNSNAKNLILAYEKGEINEHSIGYRVLNQKKEKDYNLLTEIDLYEGSSLTVPAANPLTPFLGFKSLENNKLAITEELFNLTEKLFKKSTTNEEKHLIKLKIKQLNQLFANSSIEPAAAIQPQKPQIYDIELFKRYLLTN